LLGIKSTAIKFGDDTKFYLSGFGMVMIASLITSGILTTQTWPYYTAVGLIAIHISNQVTVINYYFELSKQFTKSYTYQ